MLIVLEFGIALLVHSGDIEHFVSTALRGCNRSGDNARRSNGEFGSALFGLANDFFALDIVVILAPPDVDVFELQLVTFETLDDNELFKLVLLGNAQPGLYDCV